MDPWLTCEVDVTIPEIPITKFEDNFAPTITDKLPDSDHYLAILEERLRRIKEDSNILAQLEAKKEACMQQLLNGIDQVNDEILNLEEPIPNSQLLRAIAPHRQALNQGELVDLVGYDQLKNEESDTEVNKDSIEKSNET